MAESGSFKPKNPKKYRGDFTKISYRSSWEKWYMEYLDRHPMVELWSSEEVVIPYFSNADGKRRRYFMDFYVKYDNGMEFLIEIKPYTQTIEPQRPTQLTVRTKKTFLNSLYTFQVNQDKWIAAEKYATANGMKFRLLTENGLRKLGMLIGGK